MKTTRELKKLSRALFFAGVCFIVVFFADWFWGPFYFNRNYRVLKYILCFAVPSLTLTFNYLQEKSLKFIGRCSAVIMSLFIVGMIVFNLIGTPWFSLFEMSTLHHISYALVCLFCVFAVSTTVAYFNKDKNTDYARFYDIFFAGYLPMMLVLYYLFYVNYRDNSIEYTVNFLPFRGEIGAFINEGWETRAMRSIGNIAYYTTISLTAARFIKKNTALWAFVLPFFICLITEAVQGVFSLGDADIDDVILNGLGALAGALIYKFIIEKLRSGEQCSE